SYLYTYITSTVLPSHPIPPKKPTQCIFPTWHISMSMQLYLFVPLIFVPLHNSPRLGLPLLLFLLAISPLCTALPHLLSGARSYVEFTSYKNVNEVYMAIQHWHFNPLLYVTPMAIGMLTGYAIKRTPNARIPGGKI